MERDEVLEVLDCAVEDYKTVGTHAIHEDVRPGYLQAGEQMAQARATIAALYAAGDKLLREIDAMVADREGDNPLTDPGCPVCTLGTVPNRLNTGLCGYHALQAALASQGAGGVEG